MNKNILKLKVLSAGLCLGATLLTGCGDKEKFGTSEINYENEELVGKIKYEDLSNYAKVVTIEQNGISKILLLMKDMSEHSYRVKYDELRYIDLKTGTTIIAYNYYYSNEETVWIVGENLNIIKEQDITGYLLEADFIKREYDVNEILKFFEENILPNLKNEEKEMIK